MCATVFSLEEEVWVPEAVPTHSQQPQAAAGSNTYKPCACACACDAMCQVSAGQGSPPGLTWGLSSLLAWLATAAVSRSDVALWEVWMHSSYSSTTNTRRCSRIGLGAGHGMAWRDQV